MNRKVHFPFAWSDFDAWYCSGKRRSSTFRICYFQTSLHLHWMIIDQLRNTEFRIFFLRNYGIPYPAPSGIKCMILNCKKKIHGPNANLVNRMVHFPFVWSYFDAWYCSGKHRSSSFRICYFQTSLQLHRMIIDQLRNTEFRIFFLRNYGIPYPAPSGIKSNLYWL